MDGYMPHMQGEEDYIWIYWQQNGGGGWFGTNIHLFQLELFQLYFLLVIGATVCILGWNCWALFLIFLNTNAENKYYHAETPNKAHTLFTHFVFSQLLDIADDCGNFILKTAQTEICRHAGASISRQQILSSKFLLSNVWSTLVVRSTCVGPNQICTGPAVRPKTNTEFIWLEGINELDVI